MLESQFQTAGSALEEEAREGRIRTQTTTFCLDSEVDDDVPSVGLDGDGVEAAQGFDSSSLTAARPVASACSEAVLPPLGAVASLSEVDEGFVKGEDLAAEPTLAFLVIAAVLKIRCSEVAVFAVLERRLAGVGEGCAWMVVVALEVRGELRRVALRGDLDAWASLLRGEEVEVCASVAFGLLGSDGFEAIGELVRQGSDGSVESEVEVEIAEDREDEVETVDWACKSERMLLLLAVEGSCFALEKGEEVGLGVAADEVEDRKRNIMQSGALSSCDKYSSIGGYGPMSGWVQL